SLAIVYCVPRLQTAYCSLRGCRRVNPERHRRGTVRRGPGTQRFRWYGQVRHTLQPECHETLVDRHLEPLSSLTQKRRLVADESNWHPARSHMLRPRETP